MATFAQLLAIMRREVVSEADVTGGGFDNDNDLYPMLKNASAEIAAHLGFPVVTNIDRTWNSGATSFAAPSGMIWPKDLIVNNREATLAPVSTTLRKRSAPATPAPVYFSFDPRESNDVFFGPPALAPGVSSGDAILRYVEAIVPGSLANNNSAWAGLFPDFHWLIPLRAGANAWDSVGERDKAAYFNDKFNQGMQVFAARLGVTNVANLIIPSERRDDPGSKLVD